MKPSRKKSRHRRPKEVWQSLTDTAKAIASHFKTYCSKQDINHWFGHNPPFPSPRVNGQYNQSECFAWFEKYIMPKRKSGDGGMDLFSQATTAKAEKEITRAAREKMELDAEFGKLIERDDARQKASAALLQYHGFVVKEIESRGPIDRREKLSQMGLTQEQVSAFFEFDSAQEAARVDRIIAHCQFAAKEADAIAI